MVFVLLSYYLIEPPLLVDLHLLKVVVEIWPKR